MVMQMLLTQDFEEFPTMFRHRIQRVANRIFSRPRGDAVAWFMCLTSHLVLRKLLLEIQQKLPKPSLVRANEVYCASWHGSLLSVRPIIHRFLAPLELYLQAPKGVLRCWNIGRTSLQAWYESHTTQIRDSRPVKDFHRPRWFCGRLLVELNV